MSGSPKPNIILDETEAESWHIVKMAKPGKNYLLPRFERMMAYKEKIPKNEAGKTLYAALEKINE